MRNIWWSVCAVAHVGWAFLRAVACGVNNWLYGESFLYGFTSVLEEYNARLDEELHQQRRKLRDMQKLREILAIMKEANERADKALGESRHFWEDRKGGGGS